MRPVTTTVDDFLATSKQWRTEFEWLRSVLLEFDVTEEIKWRKPVYVFGGTNLFILQPFKNFGALLITNGALLDDPKGLLETQGEHTQGARRIAFSDLDRLTANEAAVRALIQAAIDAEAAGLKVAYTAKDELELADELRERLADDAALAEAFDALTPGRQRSWNIHISSAKQSKTRTSRVDKAIAAILAGKGHNER